MIHNSNSTNSFSPYPIKLNSSFDLVDKNKLSVPIYEIPCKGLLDNYVLMLNEKVDKVCYNFSEVYDISSAILLGEGSFGKVYSTFNKLTNNKVAIKIAKSKFDTLLFKKEINNLKKIINICKDFICIESYGFLDGKIFIAMEYLDGISLGRYITSLDVLDITLTEKIFIEIF